jgi:hypothetical protein
MAKENDGITRRDFNRQSLLALFAGVTVTISGCSDDEPNEPTPIDRAGDIANNHGHTATISAADQSAGGTVNLNIQGAAAHTHQVSLTAAEVLQVRNGQRVTATSTTTLAHQHTVTFN